MEYRRKGDKIVARLDRGEELVEKLRELAALENIRFATVTGRGQSRQLVLYTFNERKTGVLNKKKPGPATEFAKREYWADANDYVLSSITGFVAGKGVDIDAVLSVPCASEYAFFDLNCKNSGMCWAGHVESAVISTTCTLVLELIDLDAHLTRPEVLGYDVLEFGS